MLAEWYFCCNIGADREKAEAYLATLEVLDSPDSDSELINVALKQLQQTDIWMRVYAVPYVFNLSQLSLGRSTNEKSRQYLVELARNLPGSVRTPLIELCSAVMSGTCVGLGEQVRSCARALADMPDRTPSEKPYLDVHEFLPETLLFCAVLLMPVEESKRLRDEHEFGLILDSALKHRCGRLAFCLAVKVARTIPDEYSPDELVRTIWTNRMCAADYEPDLLQSIADLLFSPGRKNASDAAMGAIDESTTLRVLRDLERTERFPSSDPPLFNSNMLPTLAREIRNVLKILLWQLVLWETAARTHPPTAAAGLYRLWRQPVPPRGKIHITAPCSMRTCSEWSSQLFSLAELRKPSAPPFDVKPSRQFSFPPPASILTTPWLGLLHQSNPDVRVYANVSNEAVQLRLLGATYTGCRLLRIAGISEQLRSSFVRLLAHTSDVLRPYEPWIKAGKPPKNRPSLTLSLPLTGLAAFVRGQILLVASCEPPAIEPALFLSIFDQDPDGYFSSSIFPSVLMAWIEDTYQSGVASRENVWKPHVKGIYERTKMFPQELKGRIDSAATVRFLADNALNVSSEEGLDWQPRNKWPNFARQMFLTPDLVADHWNPDWDRATVPPTEDYDRSKKNFQVTLVRSIERVASLNRPGTLAASEQNVWRNEWSYRMRQIGSKTDADRFTRARLLELLDDPVFRHSHDDQVLIALVLLEFGSERDWRILFDRLFPVTREKWQSGIPEARHDVRLTVMSALFREFQRVESRQSDSGQVAKLQPPRMARSEARKFRLLQDTLCRIAQFNVALSDPRAQTLTSRLSKLYDELHYKQINALQKRTASIENIGDDVTLVCPAVEKLPPEWSIRMAAVDVNGFAATLIADPVDTSGCLNLFEWDRPAVERFLRDKVGGEVLGLIVSRKEESGRYSYTYNCGLPFNPTWPSRRRFSSSTRLVKVLLRWEEQRGLWSVEPSELPRTEQSGSCVADRLRVGAKTSLASGRPINPDVWCPNLSKYVGVASSHDLEVYATVDEDGRAWVPIDRDLAELLLARSGPENPDDAIVLTYVDDSVSASGEAGWRFCANPGESYVLYPEQFVAEDRPYITERLEMQPTGLLMTVCRTMRLGRTLLCLAREIASPQEYQDLRTPFDTRNIEWAQLFQGEDSVRAEKRQGQWIATGISKPPGNWPDIKVKWKDYYPPFAASLAEVTDWHWDFKKGELEGNNVRFHELRLVDEEPLHFVQRWLGLRRGDPLDLIRIQGKVLGDGYALCCTSENILIKVDAESLTMNCLRDGAVPASITDQTPRKAEVVVSNWNFGDSFITETVPREFQINREYQGVISRIPDRHAASGKAWRIWWLVDNEIVQQEIERQAGANCLGGRMRASFRDGQWLYEVDSFSVTARALWKLVEARPGQRLLWLGISDTTSGRRAVAEVNPGSFAILPERIQNSRHLAEGSIGGEFSGGLNPGCRCSRQSARHTGGHILLSLGDRQNAQLSGLSSTSASDLQFLLQEVKIAVQTTGSDFRLGRRFLLRPVPKEDASAASRTSALDSALQETLEAYFGTPRNLDGTYHKNNGIVRCRIETKICFQDLAAPVATGEVANCTAASYASAKTGVFPCIFRLRGTPQSYSASFSDVPPIGLAGFRDVLGSSETDVDLEEKLYFAPTDSPLKPGEPEPTWRFEWGYGKVLEVPQSQLQYQGQRFEQAASLLFYGDAVTSVSLFEEPARNMLLMSIEKVDISKATSLYKQGVEYRIIHLLELKVEHEEIKIDSVIGFSDGGREAHTEFDVSPALTQNSIELLKRRLIDHERNRLGDGSKPVILARLQTTDFERSMGRRLLFEHVRLSFLSSGEGAPLRSGDRVFLRANDIQPMKNDCALYLLPWEGTIPEDIGPDLRACRVLRRDFSVREDLLPRILEEHEKGDAALRNTKFLVRLRPNKEGRVLASLLDLGMPARNLSVLPRIIATESPYFARIVSCTEDRLRIESRPGVFFDIPVDHISGDLRGMARPGIVQIDYLSDNQKYRVTSVTSGTERYLPEGVRPGVALPLNSLFDMRRITAERANDPSFWANKNWFTVGGLPDMLAQPGTWNDDMGVWERPSPDKFTVLMQTEHPKVVLLGRDDQNRLRADVCPVDWTWGKLDCDVTSRRVWAVVAGSEEMIDWTHVSFADCSIMEMLGRLKLTWKYHDNQTGRWLQNLEAQWAPIKDCSALNGTVFFDHEQSYLTLRYQSQQFARYGYPVEDLVRRVALAPAEWFVVAGASNSGGLWIELAPGHLAELPAHLLMWTGDSGTHGISLRTLNWRDFAPGDRVRLQGMIDGAAPDDIIRKIANDRIAFLDWRPGPRNTFGPGKTLLPVDSYDAQRGALKLGHGLFSLEIPTSAPDPSCSLVSITRDNQVAAAAPQKPESGDTVLLGVSPQGQPAVLGFDQFIPVPESLPSSVWHGDPLAEDLKMNLKECIEAVGGALPVTVVDVRGNNLLFSRQYQCIEASPDCVRLGQVLGLAPDRRSALIRIGATILKAPMDEIVCGLPQDFEPVACDLLRASSQALWLRYDGNHLATFAITPDEAEESADSDRPILAEVIGAVETPAQWGLVCRSTGSMRLYWLPAHHASWTALTHAELCLAFPAKHRFNAVIQYRNQKPFAVSAIAVSEATKEFDELSIGNKLAVTVLGKRMSPCPSPKTLYLVRSLRTKIVLACETQTANNVLSGDITVEVVRRNKGFRGVPASLTVTPVGTRTYSLDLPSLFLTSPCGRQRIGFSQYLSLRQANEAPADTNPGSIKQLTDDQLKNLLCWAWDHRQDLSHLSLSAGVGASCEWERRMQVARETELPYGLITVLLLYGDGDRSPEEFFRLYPAMTMSQVRGRQQRHGGAAVDLLRHIGRRALRSLHAEIISTQWLFSSGVINREDGLWPRLKELETALKPEISRDLLDLITRFCKACSLRPFSDLTVISDALLAAAGQIDARRDVFDKAEITNELIRIYQSLLPSSRLGRLNLTHENQLRRLLDVTTARGLDIVLLNPLPKFQDSDTSGEPSMPRFAA